MSEPTEGRREIYVAVVGAEITGAACAAALAERGVRVTLHDVDGTGDRKTRPHIVPRPLTSATRTEIERLGSADQIPIGPPLPTAYSITVPGVAPLESAFEAPLVTVSTDRLEAGLRARAVSLGAEIADSSANDVRYVDGAWVVEDQTGEWRTSHVVFALEPVHPWAERFGVQPEAIGEVEVVEVAAASASRDDRLKIELGTLPRGYFWTAPIAGRVFAGLMSPAMRTPRASRMLHAFLMRHGIGDRGILSRHRAAVYSITNGPVPIEPDALWIGSSASWTDPVTGAGHGSALRAARCAASIVASGAGAASISKTRRSFTAEHEAATRVADVLYGQPARFIEAVHAEPEMFDEISARAIGLETYASLFGRLRATKVQRFLSRITT